MSNNDEIPKERIDSPYPPLTRRQFVTKGEAATASSMTGLFDFVL